MENTKFTVTCSRGSHLYSCGEIALFTIQGRGPVHIELSRDGAEILQQWDEKISEEHPFEISGTLKEPGFLRCTAWFEDKDAPKKQVICGTGFDVTSIRPVFPEPEDFDDFWEKAMRDDAQVEPDFQMKKVDELSNERCTVYTVDCATAGRRIYAWLSIPAGKGPFPGLVSVPGAGVGKNNPYLEWLYDSDLEDKIATFVITVHPFPLPVKCDSLGDYIKKFYNEEQYPESQKGYFGSGLTDDPKDFFFYRFVPGAVKMTNWFAKQNFVDPSNIIYHGGSQGGFMGHFLAAFTSVFKAAQFFVPSAYSDVGGPAVGRHPAQSHIKPAAEHCRSLRYFDSANAARRIKCPVQTFIGFADDICFPSGVYAAYNSMTCEKNVINLVHAGHGGDPAYGAMGNGFVRGQLGITDEWM